jgi:hypothetical protein
MRKGTQKLENGKRTSNRQTPRGVDDGEPFILHQLEPLSSTGSTSSCGGDDETAALSLLDRRPRGRGRAYERSPRRRRASWMSLGWMVTRLAWMAAKLVSSKSETR